MPIRLVLADDHPIVLEGLDQLFGRHEDFRVVGHARDGEQAIEVVRASQPDILLLDLAMPVKDGLTVLRELSGDRLDTKVVLLTAALDEADVLQAVRLGAAGVVLKEASADHLLGCLRRVQAGEKCIDDETLMRAYDELLKRERSVREAASVLTARELEIVRMVAQGHRNKEIADRLSISAGTVKIHLHNIYEKLKIDGRVALVLYAQEKRLV